MTPVTGCDIIFEGHLRVTVCRLFAVSENAVDGLADSQYHFVHKSTVSNMGSFLNHSQQVL